VQIAILNKNQALGRRQRLVTARQGERRRLEGTRETKEASEITRSNSEGDFDKVQMSSGDRRLNEGILNGKE